MNISSAFRLELECHVVDIEEDRLNTDRLAVHVLLRFVPDFVRIVHVLDRTRERLELIHDNIARCRLRCRIVFQNHAVEQLVIAHIRAEQHGYRYRLRNDCARYVLNAELNRLLTFERKLVHL
ncbi:hypothetical protein D3C84_745900 [compost metagenome]